MLYYIVLSYIMLYYIMLCHSMLYHTTGHRDAAGHGRPGQRPGLRRGVPEAIIIIAISVVVIIYV